MENLWMFLQQTAAVSLTALFLLVLQRIFLDKLSPRWQYGVWFVLLLRLLIPVGFLGRQTVLDVSYYLELLRTEIEVGLSSAYSSPYLSALPGFPVPIPQFSAPVSWTDWAFLVYWAGVLLSALWFVGGALNLSRRVRGGVPVEGERREQIQALAERYSLPLPRSVVECRWSRTPFVLGVLRPTLVLPMDWELDGKVILHELLHVKYRDVWAGWLTTLFRCLHWCNPFLWFIFDKIGNDREALCDQRVLERLEGEERRDYGRVLLAMADNESVRTPGATTMANGARAVKARIAAIARFKRVPQGMGLVSGCIVAALSLALAVGVPALAAEDQPVELTVGGTADALTTAAQNRPTTVAGALDAYGKSISLRHNRYMDCLLCTAMVTPPADMPAALEDWREMVGAHSSPEAKNWHWAGPVFRGLVSDGADAYLCQVFWFRDVELERESDPLWPEEGNPWPVEYLCHTVRVNPYGRFWTVEKLAETSGLYDGGLGNDLADWYDSLLYGPVTWSGEANGVSVELSSVSTLESGGGALGMDNLRTYQGWSGVRFYSMLNNQAEERPFYPLPHTRFTIFQEALRVQVENTGGTPYNIKLWAEPGWEDPEIAPSGGVGWSAVSQEREGRWKNYASLSYSHTFPILQQGESVILSERSGSGAGQLGDDLEPFLNPDFFTVKVQVGAGEPFQIPLTPRYTTPDGGSFSPDGEGAVS